MYVTLPSNSSPDYYPENKISDYIVHLPKELQLPGSWEVGLNLIFSHFLDCLNCPFTVHLLLDHPVYLKRIEIVPVTQTIRKINKRHGISL